MMDSYALSKFQQFNRWGRLEDLDEAIRSAERVIEGIPQTHPNWAGLLNNLGIMLQARFERLGTLGDLEESIKKAGQVLESTPAGHPNLTIYLSSLGNRLQRRFEHTGRIEDLELAIRTADKAVRDVPHGHPYTAGCLRDLTVKLARRYELLGRKEDLEQAICMSERAIESTAKGDREMARMLHNIGNMYESRFNSTGEIEDLQRAIDNAKKAVESTPMDHPDMGDMLNQLGATLMKQFEATGNLEHLAEAIHIAEQAVEATPKNHPYLAGCLTNLGHDLWRRFERTGRKADLEEAIRKVELAVKATPPGSPDFPSRSNSLGAILYTRYERAGNKEDLERAILAIERAIKAKTAGPRSINMYYNNLSILLVNRFDRTKRSQDLEEAIRSAEQAVKATPEGDPGQAAHWNNLGAILEKRFLQTGTLEDLDQAIHSAESSVKATPDDHIDLSGRLNNLGHRLCLSPQRAQSDEALECFKRSWNCASGIPFHRVDAARQAVRLLKQREQWGEARKIASNAVDLLAIMNNRSLDRHDQQHVASKFSGLVSDACSLSLQLGDSAAKALELLERGRGVIMGLLIDDRSDITHLRASYPEQADLYERLRGKVNQSTQLNGDFNAEERTTRERLNLVGELYACINGIRKLPGFERFLLGHTSEELMTLAREGPIAVVNVTDLRSDAFIISPSAIRYIRLPGNMAARAKDWVRLTKPSTENYNTRNNKYIEFLRALWSECVKDILLETHHCSIPTKMPLPRMWWVGAGIASGLPFHAAGDHSKKSTENTASWAISSYIPTLKALAYARERAHRKTIRSGQQSTLLIVDMPDTPDQIPLPFATDEAKAVKEATKRAISLICHTNPNAKKVLHALGECDMVHFACHGVSDDVDPLSSYLVFRDDAGPIPQIDKLTVREISDASLSHARIAYLSACSTAENNAQQLVDEVIHLASGFQVAGFSHVVAAMWPADDQVCVEVAKGFYEQLVAHISVLESNETVAAALHHSVEKVRGQYRRAPMQWAPFIHIGA
jgi:tetratricopeptide (TPR) repeat protein